MIFLPKQLVLKHFLHMWDRTQCLHISNPTLLSNDLRFPPLLHISPSCSEGKTRQYTISTRNYSCTRKQNGKQMFQNAFSMWIKSIHSVAVQLYFLNVYSRTITLSLRLRCSMLSYGMLRQINQKPPAAG